MGRYTRNRVIELVVLAVVAGSCAVLAVVSLRGPTLAEFLGERGFSPAPCDATFPELRDTTCYRGPESAQVVLGSISAPPVGGRGLPRVTTYIGVVHGTTRTLRIAPPTREAIAAQLAEAGLAPPP